MSDLMRVGRKLSSGAGPCTLYRVMGDDADDDQCIGMADTPEIAALICAAVNAYGHPVPPSRVPLGVV